MSSDQSHSELYCWEKWTAERDRSGRGNESWHRTKNGNQNSASARGRSYSQSDVNRRASDDDIRGYWRVQRTALVDQRNYRIANSAPRAFWTSGDSSTALLYIIRCSRSWKNAYSTSDCQQNKFNFHQNYRIRIKFQVCWRGRQDGQRNFRASEIKTARNLIFRWSGFILLKTIRSSPRNRRHGCAKDFTGAYQLAWRF